MKRISLSLTATLLLASCQSDHPFPKVVLGTNLVEPIWSSYVGCSGGIQFGPGTVSLARRIGNEYESWQFNVATGTLINYSTSPTRIGGPPHDTPVDLTEGSPKPLDRSKMESLTPPGFTPVVLTDRFLFAKRTKTRLRRLRFYSEGQVVVVDRQSRNAVWTDEDLDVSILAASGRVIVCRDRQMSVFGVNAGRPAEVSKFYAAVRAANVNAVRALYPLWHRSQMHDVDGKAPLSVAAKGGQLGMAKLLVELGENPSGGDSDGFTPLMMALQWNHSDIAEYLLDSGAAPNVDGPIWGSALRIAVHEGGRTVIDHLLSRGAEIDAVEAWSGRTALHEAVMYRNYEAIHALIRAGAKVMARDKEGKTPSELAPTDPCVVHLFRGGLIKDEPTACQKVKRDQTVTFDLDPTHLWH